MLVRRQEKKQWPPGKSAIDFDRLVIICGQSQYSHAHTWHLRKLPCGIPVSYMNLYPITISICTSKMPKIQCDNILKRPIPDRTLSSCIFIRCRKQRILTVLSCNATNVNVLPTYKFWLAFAHIAIDWILTTSFIFTWWADALIDAALAPRISSPTWSENSPYMFSRVTQQLSHQ